MLEAWRTRELGIYRYIVLDAQYEKVRQAGQVLDAAVLIACGIDDDGHRDILGCSVSLSEAEVHWRAFLSELKDRGLCGVELIVSDAHEGLAAARKAVFPSVPWQRCQFHLQQNAGHYVPKMSMRAPVAADIRAIFVVNITIPGYGPLFLDAGKVIYDGYDVVFSAGKRHDWNFGEFEALCQYFE
jgi:transposase-like protein